MLTFKQLVEKMGKGIHQAGKHIFDTKVGKRHLMIHKEKGKFVTYIDMEKLDTYRTQREAEKMGREFIKQYKGK